VVAVTESERFAQLARSYAHGYASSGFVTMPLNRFENVPHAVILGSGWRFCTCTGEPGVPLVGHTQSSDIDSWWRTDSLANLGLVTGQRSRLLVLDVDNHGKSGPASFHRWEWERQQEGKRLPDHPGYRTRSGVHRWFLLPDGVHVKTNLYWLDGIEVKACGGQVAVPPSLRQVQVPGVVNDTDPEPEPVETLVQYEWSSTVPIPFAPGWLIEDVTTRQDAGKRRGGNGNGGDNGGRGSGLPTTEWFLEHGFGAEGGHREPDCRDLATRLWRRYRSHEDGEEIVTAIIRQAWERTADKPGGKPFTWDDARQKITRQRKFVGAQVERDAREAQRIYSMMMMMRRSPR